jgi:hypothetical protein
MGSSMKVTLMTLVTAMGIGFALNPIHEGSYNLVPGGNFKANTTLSTGVIVRSQTTSLFEIPLGIAMKATPRVELGARLQTQWGDHRDLIPYMVFGVKWRTLHATSVQADLLLGNNFDNGKGFSIGTYKQIAFSSWFHTGFTSRVGFMEALVDNDALMALEAGFYPTLVVTRGLSLEVGMIGSSQTTDFEPYLAIDLQPALRVGYSQDSMVETAVALGLAGDHKEELRVKVAIIHGF